MSDPDCSDQAHWIFAGVLAGLVSGTLILWFLNCFSFPSNPDQLQTNSGAVSSEP